MIILAEAVLILAGWALMCWAYLVWREARFIVWIETDPYAADVAEFRRELHDWDRP